MNRFKSAFEQLCFLYYDLRLLVNQKWWRWFTCWFGSSAGVILSYRLDRFFYLLMGDSWAIVRIFFFPLFLFLRLLSSNHEIHYRAKIGRGLKILHCNLGVVISGSAEIGDHLTLTGGNCIGGRRAFKVGELVIGDGVALGRMQ